MPTPPGRMIYVERNDIKVTKKDFPDMQIWLLAENRIFWPWIQKKL